MLGEIGKREKHIFYNNFNGNYILEHKMRGRRKISILYNKVGGAYSIRLDNAIKLF